MYQPIQSGGIISPGNVRPPSGYPGQSGGQGNVNLPDWLKAIINAPRDALHMEDIWGSFLYGDKYNPGSQSSPSNGLPGQPTNGDPFGILDALHQAEGGFGFNSQPQQQQLDPNGPPAHQAGQVFQQTQQPGLTDTQQILQQLMALIGQPTGGYSQEDLQSALDQAAAGIRQQYGGQIGALRRANQGARKDTNAGTAQVQKMYAALAKTFAHAGNREMRQGKQLANQLQGMGQNSQQALTNQAQDLNQSSAAAAAGLGLPDLGQALISKTNKTAQRLGNVASSRGDMAGQTALGQAGNERTFMNAGDTGSRLEGTNRAADMVAQLQDYLSQNRAGIADLAGQRAQALANSTATLTSQFNAGAQDQQQNYFDQLMQLAQLSQGMSNDAFDQQMQTQNDAFDQQSSNGSVPDFSSLLASQSSGPAAILAALPRKDQQILDPLYGQLSNTDQIRTGYANPTGQQNGSLPLQGNVSNMEAFVKQALGSQWDQLSPTDQMALINMMLLRIQGMKATAPSVG